MSKFRASIDIGSNSILLLIARCEGEKIEVLESLSRVTALGFKLDEKKEFHPSSLETSYNVLEEYALVAQKYEIPLEEVIVTATEASRVATNAKEFYKKVKAEIGLSVTIITGAGEAYYSARGILLDVIEIEKSMYILDIGGASSEIIEVNNKKEVSNSYSMPFGAVRATNWLEKGIMDESFDQIRESFHSNLEKTKTQKLFCVAGTMTSVANMLLGHSEFKEKKIHGFNTSIESIFSLYRSIRLLTEEQIIEKYPFLGKRVKTIKGGMKVALAIFDWLEVKSIEISTYGLRYGTLIEGGIKDEFVA